MFSRKKLIGQLCEIGFERHTPNSSWQIAMVNANSKGQLFFILFNSVGVDIKIYDDCTSFQLDENGQLYTRGGQIARFPFALWDEASELDRFIYETALKLVDERSFSERELGFTWGPLLSLPSNSLIQKQLSTVPVQHAQLTSAQAAGRSLLPVLLLLFDLDDTLIDSGDLERFRGLSFLDPQDEFYRRDLTAACNNVPRVMVHHAHLLALRANFPDMRIGIFTRSPRCYAEVVLNVCYPDFAWDTLIAYEDVHRTKPHPDGVHKAMAQMRIDNIMQVTVLGDSKSDLFAAYHAGVRYIHFEPSGRRDWFTRERVPDAIISSSREIASVLIDPVGHLPALERALADGTSSMPWRFDLIKHQNQAGHQVPIYVAGKLFTSSKALASRVSWHAASRSVLESKHATSFPRAWLETISAFLDQVAPKLTGVILVTVVPAKPERVPRLETLLSEVAQLFRQSSTRYFVPNLLAFRSGVRSHSGEHLSRPDRMKNAWHHLYVTEPRAVRSKNVVVIDDVVTSGATLLVARERLLEAGARTVTCFALTKTVRDSLHATDNFAANS